MSFETIKVSLFTIENKENKVLYRIKILKNSKKGNSTKRIEWKKKWHIIRS